MNSVGCSSQILAGILILCLVLTCGCCTTNPCRTVEIPAPVTVPEPGGMQPFVLSGVPDLRQNASYTCGATALQAVISYWGDELPEDTLVAMLNTTEENGTPPQSIVNVSHALGYDAEIHPRLSLADLEALVRAGIPVIIGTEEHRSRTIELSEEQGRDYGHYMVVIGFDADNVWLEDPAVLGRRAVIPREGFLARWQVAGKDIRSPEALTVTRMAIIIRENCTKHAPCEGPE